MESFKRLNKNSKLELVKIEDFKLAEYENVANMILQIVPLKYPAKVLNGVGEEVGYGVDCTLLVVEYILRLEENLTTPTTNNATEDFELLESLDTVINKDPFGGHYSGKKIREIFESGDTKWLDRAIADMRNDFIRDKLVYIMEKGGYGKIICK